MSATSLEWFATAFFALAIVHTFSTSALRGLGNRFAQGSVAENFFHFLGEVEAVFGTWAAALFIAMTFYSGYPSAVHYLETLDFTEPLFVFVIMAVAATKPVLQLARACIQSIARWFPLKEEASYVFAALVVGPLLGSFITEPAAMTVTAILLKERLFDVPKISKRVKYFALGVLFVNVSIGGVLTPYAAPPVLMVAKAWGWDFPFMLQHFGWKAALAVCCNAALLVAYAGRQLRESGPVAKASKGLRVPGWVVLVHVGVLAGVVLNAHHPVVFFGVFLFFLAFVEVTSEFQFSLKLKESLLVGCFLAGLVVLGGMQAWWLQPLLSSLSEPALFLGSTALTAVTDNAALTFLGAQVQGLSESMKYALVAGAVAGGGLTVIANAPNPAGYSILQKSFGRSGVNPIGLLLGAAVPTLVVVLCFWFLPHFSN